MIEEFLSFPKGVFCVIEQIVFINHRKKFVVVGFHS